MNLQSHIRRYLDLAARADSLFENVRNSHAELLGCKRGCDDCCSVYFQLTLIEAFVVSSTFREALPRNVVRRILRRAESVEPLFIEARELLASVSAEGREDDACLQETAAKIRVPCPLNEEGGCVLYDHRPITCRLYGIPQKIHERVVTCPHGSFEQGVAYPTVDVNEIQGRLGEYSQEFLGDLLGIELPRERTPLFFLPTALRTTFDKAFFLSLEESLR
jgi:Fe-S-cluster containining protein